MLVLFCFSCLQENKKEQVEQNIVSEPDKKIPAEPEFDIQGHRGARGYYPENTINGFLLAMEMGVTTLEMDAVIAGDGEVMVSHEPWISATFCQEPNENPISEEDEKRLNIYKMSFDEVMAYDCGRKAHPRFPKQQKEFVGKPRLADVITKVQEQIEEGRAKPVWYNIETKSSPEGDNIYHPEPKEFVRKLMEVIQAGGIEDFTVIQSFDIRTLQEVHKTYPNMKTALLIGEMEFPLSHQLTQLGFMPEIYSPNHELLNEELVSELHNMGLKVIPWTVNDPKRIKELIDMGVDGIISDYPDLVYKAKNQST